MNILFFLTPKAEVSYVKEQDSLRQVLEKMEYHGFSAVPVLSEQGHYIGTVTEGDLLWALKDEGFPDIKAVEPVHIVDIKRRRDNMAVRVHSNMEDLFGLVLNQNFVPVVDDENVFIGIVTRKDIICYLSKERVGE